MNPCNDEGLCGHMSARIVQSGPGLYAMDQVQQGRVVTIGVLYKRSTKDRGLMLNICPWCEARIDHLNEANRVKP